MTEASEATRRPPGTPCWVSLMVHSLGSTEEFYTDLFGWEYEPGPEQLGPYVQAVLDGREVAGIGEMPPDRDLPVAWTTYLATDDADATAESIRSCGGTVAVGPLDAGIAGRVAICSDPLGAIFGIWQAQTHMGTRLHGLPGTPVWNELITQDTTTVGKFYEHVFGHEGQAHPEASEEFDHVTLRLQGRPVAAVHGVGRSLPHDRGPHWMTYFEVADTDGAAAHVELLGGSVLQPPHDGPGGRLATVADPEGAVFTIIRTTP
ncbi:VOC family protein [Streptomyces sp. Mg1]|uniref:VOC family protein n=1 Tax=Streptomyces sp. Mg1 TaxID=465541 RepID=UPI00017E9E08|nr:VOC family protein [Streptomyces sp. Mg1]AKL68279.1 glyoxalase/bleomycin resistance protein/dioxygenase [Streptomyces sp. Mg1]EDX24340.1 hydroxylase [Streptomyces sp. Mg1]